MTETHTATILVTDLVRSTEMRVRLGEEAAEELRRRHDAVLRDAITSHAGTCVKSLGDGVLAMFDSASAAVSASVAIQQAVDLQSRDHPDHPLEVRIGLSAGDVTLEDGDCFGTPVVEASRLCAAATGGQILAAELVRLLARGRGTHTFVTAGERAAPEPRRPRCDGDQRPPGERRGRAPGRAVG
ncbi:MAG: adenylate/guanylate cyclase domain-containing protein [Acidimicrobiales bacterium]